MDWKKCTDELPPEDKPVLAVGRRGGLFVGERPHWRKKTDAEGTVYMMVKNARSGRFCYMWTPIEKPEEFR